MAEARQILDNITNFDKLIVENAADNYPYNFE